MSDTDTLLAQLIGRVPDELLARADHLLPAAPVLPDLAASIAFRWRRKRNDKHGGGQLVAVVHPHPIRLSDLEDIDQQKARIDANTRQFVPASPPTTCC